MFIHEALLPVCSILINFAHFTLSICAWQNFVILFLYCFHHSQASLWVHPWLLSLKSMRCDGTDSNCHSKSSTRTCWLSYKSSAVHCFSEPAKYLLFLRWTQTTIKITRWIYNVLGNSRTQTFLHACKHYTWIIPPKRGRSGRSLVM